MNSGEGLGHEMAVIRRTDWRLDWDWESGERLLQQAGGQGRPVTEAGTDGERGEGVKPHRQNWS